MSKVLLIERHPILMRGLQQVLEGVDRTWEVIGADILDLTSPVGRDDIDLVVFSLPQSPAAIASGIEVVQRATYPAKILLLCDVIDGEFPDIPPYGSVCGYISKGASIALLEAAVRLVMAGGECFPASLRESGRVAEESDLLETEHDGGSLAVQVDSIDAQLLNITPRQYEVLLLLARGYPIKTVSRMLNISIATAKTHAYKLYRTLNVKNKSEAVYEALRRGATLDWVPPRLVVQRQSLGGVFQDMDGDNESTDVDSRQSALF